jgi:hypothetical protein
MQHDDIEEEIQSSTSYEIASSIKFCVYSRLIFCLNLEIFFFHGHCFLNINHYSINPLVSIMSGMFFLYNMDDHLIMRYSFKM